ncbi:Indole-3-acetic acid-induced protein ARG2, partial [Cucurbita argyrosperma subsp. sororia]
MVDHGERRLDPIHAMSLRSQGRGYTAEAMAASKRAARDDGMMKKGEQAERSREKVAWVPDPVTGYYRPENYSDEIDAVDLRAMMLQPRRKFIEQNE